MVGAVGGGGAPQSVQAGITVLLVVTLQFQQTSNSLFKKCKLCYEVNDRCTAKVLHNIHMQP